MRISDWSSDVCSSDLDPAQVESALANLAINARDAMPKGGCLTIQAANQHLDEIYAAQNSEVAPGDYVMLAVSDPGGGIASQIPQRVVDPLLSTKTHGQGTVLGLTMASHIDTPSAGHSQHKA